MSATNTEQIGAIEGIVLALTPLAAPDGHVRLSGSTWIVSAWNP